MGRPDGGASEKMLTAFWRDDHFVVLSARSHEEIESESLLFMPILLGKRLLDDVLVAGLKQEGRFLPHKVWQSKGSTVLTMNLMVTGTVQFGHRLPC
jgi:hypothetical protein